MRDCIAVSFPETSNAGDGGSTEGPTYMPTTDGKDNKSETQTENDEDNLSLTGTTPHAMKDDKEMNNHDSSGYVLQLDENFNPINPTTVAAQELNDTVTVITTDAPVYSTKEADDGAGTTPWAMENEESSTASSYVLQLDENYNPINPTTVAASAATDLHKVSLLRVLVLSVK